MLWGNLRITEQEIAPEPEEVPVLVLIVVEMIKKFSITLLAAVLNRICMNPH
jgi:hypothetical protein